MTDVLLRGVQAENYHIWSMNLISVHSPTIVSDLCCHPENPLQWKK